MLPRGDHVQPGIGLTGLAGRAGVKVDAEGAAVDLGGPEPNHLEQAALEVASIDPLLKTVHGLVELWLDGAVIDSRIHPNPPLVGALCEAHRK